MLSPGTAYVILNASGGSVMAMDLSGTDNASLLGYPMHGGPNQQWDFIPSGLGYIIRCLRPSKGESALYLTINCAGVREGASVVVSGYPVAWNVEETEGGIMYVYFDFWFSWCTRLITDSRRISWPNSKYVFELGDKAAGTKVCCGSTTLCHYFVDRPCS